MKVSMRSGSWDGEYRNKTLQMQFGNEKTKPTLLDKTVILNVRCDC